MQNLIFEVENKWTLGTCKRITIIMKVHELLFLFKSHSRLNISNIWRCYGNYQNNPNVCFLYYKTYLLAIKLMTNQYILNVVNDYFFISCVKY